MGYYDYVNFEQLQGKTLVEVKVQEDSNITFITSTGESFEMYHDQDCCEHVRIESVVGDWADMLGYPLLKAEESTNQDNPPEYADSYTWTFYKLATIKGYVDIRWLGESNGYYSESVSLHKGREYSQEEVLSLITKNHLKVQNIVAQQETLEESKNMILEKEQNKIEAQEVKEIYKKKNSRFNL